VVATNSPPCRLAPAPERRINLLYCLFGATTKPHSHCGDPPRTKTAAMELPCDPDPAADRARQTVTQGVVQGSQEVVILAAGAYPAMALQRVLPKRRNR
jgi:6-phosphogluconolactonase/glucosamine-6-phosphate isomerase/deaminase